MIEIERKFLVLSEIYKHEAHNSTNIEQGYLNPDPARTVRVRIKGEKGYLTIKGIGSKSGISRFEWEKEIPIDEAKMLMNLCESGIIQKTRFEVTVGNHLIEIDDFYGDNQGLVVAEIELNSEEELFEKPNWLGEEVTNDQKYYNAQLSQNPFKNW